MENIRYLNNPFEDVIKAVKELCNEPDFKINFDKRYPSNIKVSIEFAPFLTNEEGEEIYGMSTFTDDGEAIISLSASLTYIDMLEVLAHELAHVMAGVENDHNAVWEKTLDDIHERYLSIAMEGAED